STPTQVRNVEAPVRRLVEVVVRRVRLRAPVTVGRVEPQSVADDPSANADSIVIELLHRVLVRRAAPRDQIAGHLTGDHAAVGEGQCVVGSEAMAAVARHDVHVGAASFCLGSTAPCVYYDLLDCHGVDLPNTLLTTAVAPKTVGVHAIDVHPAIVAATPVKH